VDLGKDKLADRVSSVVTFHFRLVNICKIKRIDAPYDKLIFRTKDREIGKWDFSDINKIILTTELGKLEFYNYDSIDDSYSHQIINRINTVISICGQGINF
jgi:hypothetical protein